MKRALSVDKSNSSECYSPQMSISYSVGNHTCVFSTWRTRTGSSILSPSTALSGIV